MSNFEMFINVIYNLKTYTICKLLNVDFRIRLLACNCILKNKANLYKMRARLRTDFFTSLQIQFLFNNSIILSYI